MKELYDLAEDYDQELKDELSESFKKKQGKLLKCFRRLVGDSKLSSKVMSETDKQMKLVKE